MVNRIINQEELGSYLAAFQTILIYKGIVTEEEFNEIRAIALKSIKKQFDKEENDNKV